MGDPEERAGDMGLERTEEDLRRFKEALKRKPGNFAPYLDVAMTLADLGKHAEALDYYAGAARLNPDLYVTYYYLAHSLHALERNDEALRAFDAAINADPDMAGAHNDKGIVLHEMGRHKAALRSYKKAAKLDPGEGDICDNVGSVLADMGLHKRAIKWYNKSIRRNPDAPYSYYHKAQSLCSMGRLEKAASCYYKVMQLESEGGEGRGGPGGPEKADDGGLAIKIKDAKKAVRADPKSELNHEKLCKLYAEAGMYAEGLESSMRLVRLNPDSAVGHRIAIECLRSVGVADVIGLTDKDAGDREAIIKKVGGALRKAGLLEEVEEGKEGESKEGKEGESKEGKEGESKEGESKEGKEAEGKSIPGGRRHSGSPSPAGTANR